MYICCICVTSSIVAATKPLTFKMSTSFDFRHFPCKSKDVQTKQHSKYYELFSYGF